MTKTKTTAQTKAAAKAHTETTVEWLPKCDFCNSQAYADGKTGFGGWAHMCRGHFLAFGTGLGLGKGQRLRLVTR